jgi:hypothetical protein
MKLILTLALVLTAAFAVAEETAGPSQETIDAFVLESAPEGAIGVAELRATEPKAGDRVTVRAQIGGRNPPWLPGMAMMLLADADELAACTTGGCGSPWDFCSAPPEKLWQHTGLVRWLGENGQPQDIGFEKLAKIAPLATVVITGTLADVGDPRALVIDADGFFFEDPGPMAHLFAH